MQEIKIKIIFYNRFYVAILGHGCFKRRGQRDQGLSYCYPQPIQANIGGPWNRCSSAWSPNTKIINVNTKSDSKQTGYVIFGRRTLVLFSHKKIVRVLEHLAYKNDFLSVFMCVYLKDKPVRKLLHYCTRYWFSFQNSV